jgi:hypothetical protein
MFVQIDQGYWGVAREIHPSEVADSHQVGLVDIDLLVQRELINGTPFDGCIVKIPPLWRRVWNEVLVSCNPFSPERKQA